MSWLPLHGRGCRGCRLHSSYCSTAQTAAPPQLKSTPCGSPARLPRAELALLRQHAADIAGQVPAGGVVLELGCGDCSKTAGLLEALVERHGVDGVRFAGVDVSNEALHQTERSLARLLPQLPEAQARAAGCWGGAGCEPGCRPQGGDAPASPLSST